MKFTSFSMKRNTNMTITSRFWSLFAIVLTFEAGLARAQVAAVATFEPSRVETGDTFVLRVIVSGSNVAPREVRFAPWAGTIPMANVLSKSTWQRSGDKWRQDFTLIAFDSAEYELPPLYVRTHLGDSIPTNPLQLSVRPTPASDDLADMAPARDIRREPVEWLDYWPWILAIAFIPAGLIWWRLRRKKPVQIAPVLPTPVQEAPLSAYAKALQQLEALEQAQGWKHKELKEYFADLSLVLREYLEHRYRIPAMESTTREIVGQLRHTDYPESLKGPLRELLDQADGVKYAQSHPAAEVPLQALRKARFIVEKTI